MDRVILMSALTEYCELSVTRHECPIGNLCFKQHRESDLNESQQLSITKKAVLEKKLFDAGGEDEWARILCQNQKRRAPFAADLN